MVVTHMDGMQESAARSHCWSCGFEAPAGGDEWETIEVVSLGTMTRCPECGSTNVSTGR